MIVHDPAQLAENFRQVVSGLMVRDLQALLEVLAAELVDRGCPGALGLLQVRDDLDAAAAREPEPEENKIEDPSGSAIPSQDRRNTSACHDHESR